MKSRTVAGVVIAACIAALFVTQTAAWSDSIPRGSVHTLDGGELELPDGLRGRIAILVIGFTQKAGSLTPPWEQRLEKDFGTTPQFAIYPAAVIADVPSIFRGFALQGIRGSVPQEKRSRFLVIEQDGDAWKKAAGLQAPDAPCVMVVGPDGTVLLRESGLFDEEKYQRLVAELRSLNSR